ncbi:MAG: bifunctional riboflavin kinase/FAD synthetase [Deltaproteobacteria bacterium]|nr:bifunctional riboflavin kinase/FAD synthetase [Deltaproteobacteria bacterium]MBI2974884.1 bifunctional riboflavin kinase/FAD synthetase [Deltaproteobacteria bacterium]
MKTIYGSGKLKCRIKRPILTIGNFDGIHLGHMEIFKRLVKAAKKVRGTSVVYTFAPHPAKSMVPDAPPLLLQTEKQKMGALACAKLDLCIIEPFTKSFSLLKADEFFGRIVLKRIKPVEIIAGHDLTFGRHRAGTVELLRELCLKHNIKFGIVKPFFRNETLISSTIIRKSLMSGDVETANKMLGRPYSLAGTVVKGRGLGAEIGFHTANLKTENELIPLRGVYITKTLAHISITNIGYNPTFGGGNLSIETHILNFNGLLYGKTIEIEFYKRLRDEKIFDSPLALSNQIKKDIANAKRYFS